MTPEERRSTEVALRHTLVGRFLCGVHFYAGQPILLADALDDMPRPVEREAFIHIGTRWRLYERMPDDSPASEDELEAQPLSELCRVAGDLQPQRIVNASLGDDAPHLLIGFEDGRVFFLNGHHEQYEPWEVNTGDFTIVCCPGGEVALWAPAEFRSA